MCFASQVLAQHIPPVLLLTNVACVTVFTTICCMPLRFATGKTKAEMVQFALTKDGSCLGAAVLAAAAARERTSSQPALALAKGARQQPGSTVGGLGSAAGSWPAVAVA